MTEIFTFKSWYERSDLFSILFISSLPAALCKNRSCTVNSFCNALAVTTTSEGIQCTCSVVIQRQQGFFSSKFDKNALVMMGDVRGHGKCIVSTFIFSNTAFVVLSK